MHLLHKKQKCHPSYIKIQHMRWNKSTYSFLPSSGGAADSTEVNGFSSNEIKAKFAFHRKWVFSSENET